VLRSRVVAVATLRRRTAGFMSCPSASGRSQCRVRGREDDARFAHFTGLPGTLGINGKQASVIWAGNDGSRRAWRTCAFCESARQHVGAGWTLAACAFAQQESSRPPRPGECFATNPIVRALSQRRSNHANSQASGAPRAGVKAQVSGAKGCGQPRAATRLWWANPIVHWGAKPDRPV
jgi:hypothetical protein